MSLLGLIPQPPGRVVSGEAFFDGRDLLKMSTKRAARGPRRRHRDGLPGPDDVAEPGAPGRRSRSPRRSWRTARTRRGRRERARGRAAQARRHPEPGAAGRAVPARVLGRDAAARDDRDGDRERAEAADRGRADDRARRDDPGADHRGAEEGAGGDARGDDPDHARPRPDRRARRSRRRHVRGPRRRAGRRLHDLRVAAAPVHDRPDGQPAAARRRRRLARADPRPAAEPDRAAARLRVPPALLPLAGARRAAATRSRRSGRSARRGTSRRATSPRS